MSFRTSVRLLIAVGCLAALASAAPVRAGDDEGGRLVLFGHRYSVIAGASAYVPQSQEIRSVYGRVAWSPVVTLWDFHTPRGLGLSFDVGGQRFHDGDRTAQTAHAGFGPRFLFADTQADVAPYLALRTDAYVVKMDGSYGDAWHVKPGSNLELGASILRHVVVSGRYDMVPRVGGVRLSGFSARLAVKVY